MRKGQNLFLFLSKCDAAYIIVLPIYRVTHGFLNHPIVCILFLVFSVFGNDSLINCRLIDNFWEHRVINWQILQLQRRIINLQFLQDDDIS